MNLLRCYQYQTDAVAHLLDEPRRGQWMVQENNNYQWRNVIGPFKDHDSCEELRGKIESVQEQWKERGLSEDEFKIILEDMLHVSFSDDNERAIKAITVLRPAAQIANLLLIGVPVETFTHRIWDYGVP